MTDTITLAQLSDVHLAPLRGLALRHLNVKRGLGYLNWQRGRRQVHRRDALDLVVADMLAHSPDHIAVTGDLINLGLPAEFEAARAWLAGLGAPDKVTVVPGNHDIYTHLGDDPGVERWADYMRSRRVGRASMRPGARAFPFVRRLGPVALIALNSAVPTPPFVAAGELGHAPNCDTRREFCSHPTRGPDPRRADPSSAAARTGAAATGSARCARA